MAEPTEIRPKSVTVTREGFRATASSKSVRVTALSNVWELTKPDSIFFWMLAEPRGGAIVQPEGYLGDEGLRTRIESWPYGESGAKLFCFYVAANQVIGRFFECGSAVAGSDSAEVIRLMLATLIGDAGPPVDLTGLRFLVDHVFTETDTTYDVAVLCTLTNATSSDRRLWVRFSAHEAGFTPNRTRVKAYFDEEARKSREAMKSGVVICGPALPWGFIQGRVLAVETVDAPVLLHPGESCTGSFTIVWKKREVSAWSPGELTATIEMEGRRVEDLPSSARLRSLLHVLAVAVPE